MKVLLLGSTGQLGTKLLETKPSSFEVKVLTRATLNLAQPDKISEVLQKESFDILINASAYNFVDLAEENSTEAMNVNANSISVMAQHCQKKGAKIVHVSTDYVFSGDKRQPYSENDQVYPLNVYGNSKVEGEKYLQSSGANFFLIRTSWVFSEVGTNFFRTIAGRLREDQPIKVVTDQTGTPTYAGDLAKFIWEGIQNKLSGTYHYSNQGEATRFDYVKAIAQLLQKEHLVSGITSDQFPSKAKRPAYSVLAKNKAEAALGIKIPNWTDALQRCFKAYKKTEHL